MAWILKSDNPQLLADIKRYEGTKEYQAKLGYFKNGKYWIYKDTKKLDTIGFGHLVLKNEYPQFANGLTESAADTLLAKDLESKVRDAQSLYVQYKMTGGIQLQMVLVQMVFQMGLAGVSAFKNTLGAMGRGDYKAAANGMRNSAWYKQTTNRAEELARIVESQK